jgi:hypothetical protein
VICKKSEKKQKVIRVKLVKQTTPELPLGSLGTVEYGNLRKRGMVRVQWDCGFNIPMYRNEIKES